MLAVSIHRVFLAQHRIDFRKHLSGLLGEAYRLGANPFEGDCVVFIKKDRTQLRAIVGDDVGAYLITRKFQGGCLRGLPAFVQDPQAKQITTAELTLLLEGATFTVHQRARDWT